MKRINMNKRQNRKNFRRGQRVHPRNNRQTPNPMRGGYRL